MTPALIDAEENRDICYCDAQIQLRADACRVIRTGHAVNNFVSGKICSHYRGPEHHRHLCLPVRESGGDGGVLQMLISEGEQACIMAQRPYIDAYLRETGSVIETKRQLRHLRESSLRDPLTGLYNRRFLTEFENTLVATLQRRLTHAVILMVDLDYFKQVNDNYGHVSGDKVLKEMAWVMQQSVRGSDLVIRYGGEEFMLLLLDAEAVNGMKVAEKIRANVAKVNIKLAGGVVRNTVSIGVADYPGDSDDFWQCVRYADAALYQAKETGRNRVERYFAELLDEAVDY
jgi:diguanylate cyclase (GGDEF)-like protein